MNATGPPHVLEMWFGVSKGMLPMKYFCSNKASFVSIEYHRDHKTVKVQENLSTLSFWTIAEFRTVVCLSMGIIFSRKYTDAISG